MKLLWRTPADFRFTTAVCAHGFFALAPNDWDPATGTLATTVQTAALPAANRGHEVSTRAAPLHVSITALRRPSGDVLQVHVPGQARLSTGQRRAVRSAIRRILRLDEDFTDFHRMCGADPALRGAADVRFGRLLRSESFFEDVVKTMCTCNITWRQTLAVVRRLVETFGQRAANDPSRRAFPTPGRLAAADPKRLGKLCGLGYRTAWVHSLARQVADGRLELTRMEDPSLTTEELYRQLRAIRGVGDYSASALCTLLGRYDRLAVDTAAIAHYRRRHPRCTKPTAAGVQKHYARYAPYSALVYWWELWSHYADSNGYPAPWAEAPQASPAAPARSRV